MTTLQEFFDRDPLSLTNDDIDEIIKEMRSKSHLFAKGNMDAGNTKKTAKPVVDLDIDFSSLDLK